MATPLGTPTNAAESTVVHTNTILVCNLGLKPCINNAEHKRALEQHGAEKLTVGGTPRITSPLPSL